MFLVMPGGLGALRSLRPLARCGHSSPTGAPPLFLRMSLKTLGLWWLWSLGAGPAYSIIYRSTSLPQDLGRRGVRSLSAGAASFGGSASLLVEDLVAVFGELLRWPAAGPDRHMMGTLTGVFGDERTGLVGGGHVAAFIFGPGGVGPVCGAPLATLPTPQRCLTTGTSRTHDFTCQA